MNSISMPQARLELALWQAEAESIPSSDLYVRMTSKGLPSEVAIRIREILDTTRVVGGKMIQIGKIIILRMLEFVEKHTNLLLGVALGAACTFLVGAVPLIGPLLMPLAACLGIVIGASAGHRLDKKQNGLPPNEGSDIITLTQDIIEIVRVFFGLFADTLSIILSAPQQEPIH